MKTPHAQRVPATVAGFPLQPAYAAAIRRDLNRQAIDLATDWSEWLRLARLDKALAVEARMPNRVSVVLAARDYGLVPHVPDYIRANGCCLDAQRRNMLAASVLRYRMAHRDGIYGLTLMEEVGR